MGLNRPGSLRHFRMALLILPELDYQSMYALSLYIYIIPQAVMSTTSYVRDNTQQLQAL